MYDRPTAIELLQAARAHYEQHIVPLTRQADRKLYFQTLVAINVMKIVERELALASRHRRVAWERLNDLLGPQPLPDSPEAMQAALAQRRAALCTAIRAGQHDHDADLFAHLKATATEQLEVANPGFLEALRAEDAAR